MINYKGLAVITKNSVYLPAEDSFLAAEALEEYLSGSGKEGLEVLDMGAGTGFLGLVAAKSGKTKSVLFADMNDEAVAICRENISFNSAVLKAECDAVRSDLFSNVNGKFDIIIFNAPYLPADEGDKKHGEISRAWSGGDEGIEISVKFLEESLGHLKEEGKVLLVASSLGSLDKLESEFKRIGFKEESRKKIHIFFEDMVVLLLGF